MRANARTPGVGGSIDASLSRFRLSLASRAFKSIVKASGTCISKRSYTKGFLQFRGDILRSDCNACLRVARHGIKVLSGGYVTVDGQHGSVQWMEVAALVQVASSKV